MTNDHRLRYEMMKELESSNPEELVEMLGISSEQLIKAFPGHAFDYIQSNFSYEDGTAMGEDNSQAWEEVERMINEEFSIFRTDEGEEDETPPFG